MNFLNSKIEHPGTAFLVYFLIGIVLAKYGIVDGALLLFSLFAGVLIYKVITSAQN